MLEFEPRDLILMGLGAGLVIVGMLARDVVSAIKAVICRIGREFVKASTSEDWWKNQRADSLNWRCKDGGVTHHWLRRNGVWECKDCALQASRVEPLGATSRSAAIMARRPQVNLPTEGKAKP